MFEIYEKGSHTGFGIGEMQVSVGKTCLTVGIEIYNLLSKKGLVEIYLDRNENKVGLKPSTDFTKGFRIHKKKESKGNAYIVGTYIKLLPKGRYDCFKEDDFIVFKVSEIAKKKQND